MQYPHDIFILFNVASMCYNDIIIILNMPDKAYISMVYRNVPLLAVSEQLTHNEGNSSNGTNIVW